MPYREADNSTNASSGNGYGADPTALRLQVRRNGYWPVPIAGPTVKTKAAGKRPLMDEWQKICIAPNEAEVSRWTREYRTSTNTGLLCGPTVGGDIDVRVPELARKLVDVARTMLGDTPLERVGMAPKTLLCYRTETPFKKISTDEFILPGDDPTVPGYKGHRVEILAEGQQFVAYGIHPDTLLPYEWLHGGPDTVPLEDLPVVTEEACRRFVAEAETILREAGGRTRDEVEGKAAKKGAASKSGAKVIDFGKASGDSSFFREVNRQAVGAIETWFPQIFPTAWQEPGTGAWRVSSKDLGRPYEEDLSMHPTKGGYDFGPEKSVSPIDVMMEHGRTADPVQAARWLCDQLGVNPKDMGWKEKTAKEQKEKADEDADTDQRSHRQRAGSRLLFWDDIDTLPTPRFLIDGFLPERGLTVLYGAPGSFKTFVALDMAMTIAAFSAAELEAGARMDWQGRKVEHGCVVYVYAEGTPGIKQRVTAWRQKHGRLGNPHSLAAIPVAANLRDPESMEQLMADIASAAQHTGLPVQLVVFDTLFRCFGGGDLSDNVDIGAATGATGRISEITGASVLLVHHENKAGTQFGSIMLYGAVDASLCVKRILDTLLVNITADKMKDAEEPSLDLAAEIVELIDPATGTPMVDPRSGTQFTSLAVVSASGADGGRTADGQGKLSAKQANALQAFWDWLNDHDAKSMDLDVWATVMVDRGVTEGPSARKRAHDLKDQLDRKGLIRIERKQVHPGLRFT